jgi:uncharacterized repeat protein (TIGR03943 family)
LATVADAAALIALALFLLVTSWMDRVRLFVAPIYVWLPPATGAVLLLLAAARLSGVFRRSAGCACSCPTEAAPGRTRFAYPIVLLIAIATAIAVDPRQFSAEGVRKRLVASAPRDLPLEKAVAWILGQSKTPTGSSAAVDFPREPTVKDLLDAVERGQTAGLEGRFLELIGQCSPSSDARRYDLYRMVVTCCIADAQSVSVEVVCTAPRKLDYGQWVRTKGVVQLDGASGLPVLHEVETEKITMPPRPYL